MGFDANIPVNLLGNPEFPEELKGSTRLLQLLETKAGETFWLLRGSSIWAEFDLTPDSPCWRRYERFTDERTNEVQP